jgi:ribosome maturation factor RimP
MIGKETIEQLVNEYIEGTDLFVVEIRVSPSGEIRIFVDNERGVSLEDCINLSRSVENSLNRDEHDFQLEVSSPGLTEPFKVLPQYKKNIGRDVELITDEGLKHTGTLTGLTGNGVVILESLKIKGEKKRPEIMTVEKEYDFDRIRSTKLVISYK